MFAIVCEPLLKMVTAVRGDGEQGKREGGDALLHGVLI
jgi:hypothetical protein